MSTDSDLHSLQRPTKQAQLICLPLQKLSELFDTEAQDKAEDTPAEEDVGSPVQLTSEWEVYLYICILVYLYICIFVYLYICIFVYLYIYL